MSPLARRKLIAFTLVTLAGLVKMFWEASREPRVVVRDGDPYEHLAWRPPDAGLAVDAGAIQDAAVP